MATSSVTVKTAASCVRLGPVPRLDTRSASAFASRTRVQLTGGWSCGERANSEIFDQQHAFRSSPAVVRFCVVALVPMSSAFGRFLTRLFEPRCTYDIPCQADITACVLTLEPDASAHCRGPYVYACPASLPMLPRGREHGPGDVPHREQTRSSSRGGGILGPETAVVCDLLTFAVTASQMQIPDCELHDAENSKFVRYAPVAIPNALQLLAKSHGPCI